MKRSTGIQHWEVSKSLDVACMGDLQAETVAAKVERCGLSPEARCRGFTSCDKSNWTSRAAVGDNPEEEESQCCLVGGCVLEEPGCSKANVEDHHAKAST